MNLNIPVEVPDTSWWQLVDHTGGIYTDYRSDLVCICNAVASYKAAQIAHYYDEQASKYPPELISMIERADELTGRITEQLTNFVTSEDDGRATRSSGRNKRRKRSRNRKKANSSGKKAKRQG